MHHGKILYYVHINIHTHPFTLLKYKMSNIYVQLLFYRFRFVYLSPTDLVITNVTASSLTVECPVVITEIEIEIEIVVCT